MKNKIKKWLGIEWQYNLRDSIINLTNINQKLEQRVSELEREKKWADMYLKGVINYLDISFDKEVIPNPMYLPEIPQTMEVLVARKNKK